MSKGATSDASVESVREYKVWSKVEERTLVNCMLELSEKRVVEKGNFKLTGLKELERMMHTRLENCTLLAVPHIKSKVRYFKDKFTATLELKEASGFGWDDANGRVIADDVVFSGWVKSHPKASGLNNKPLPFFEELSKVFGVDHAHGLDAVQAADAATILEPVVHATEFVGDYTPPTVESYTFPTHLDQEQVMEELINQGLDLQATGLKHVEAGIAAAAAKGKAQGSATSSGTKRSRSQVAEDERSRMAEMIGEATDHLARIATNYCIEGDVSVRRQCLYNELGKLTSLSVVERTRALRHLNRDDGDAMTYFMLPTEEEKLAFIKAILE